LGQERVHTVRVAKWKDNNNWLIGWLYLHPVTVKNNMNNLIICQQHEFSANIILDDSPQKKTHELLVGDLVLNVIGA
jgi:hypothetical protein